MSRSSERHRGGTCRLRRNDKSIRIRHASRSRSKSFAPLFFGGAGGLALLFGLVLVGLLGELNSYASISPVCASSLVVVEEEDANDDAYDGVPALEDNERNDDALTFKGWSVNAASNADAGMFTSSITMGRYLFMIGGAEELRSTRMSFETYVYVFGHKSIKVYDYHKDRIVVPWELIKKRSSDSSSGSGSGSGSGSSNSTGNDSDSSDSNDAPPSRKYAELLYPAIGAQNAVRIGLTTYIIGFCTAVPETVDYPVDDENTTGRTSKFLRSVQRIRLYEQQSADPDDITVDIENWTIPYDTASVALRYNSSCVASGDSIFIIGGVGVKDRLPLDSIAQYNVRLNRFVDGVRSTGSPLITPGVVANSGVVFIVGGITLSPYYYKVLTNSYDIHILMSETLDIYRSVQTYGNTLTNWPSPKPFVLNRQLAIFGEVKGLYEEMRVWDTKKEDDAVYTIKNIGSPVRPGSSVGGAVTGKNMSMYMFGGRSSTGTASADIFAGNIVFRNQNKLGAADVSVAGMYYYTHKKKRFSASKVAAQPRATDRPEPSGEETVDLPALEVDSSSSSSSSGNNSENASTASFTPTVELDGNETPTVSLTGTPSLSVSPSLSLSQTVSQSLTLTEEVQSDSDSTNEDPRDIPNNLGNITVHINGYVPLWYNTSFYVLFEESIVVACPGIVKDDDHPYDNTTSTCELMLSLSDKCDAVIATPGFLSPNNTELMTFENYDSSSSSSGAETVSLGDGILAARASLLRPVSARTGTLHSGEKKYYGVGPYKIIGTLEEGVMSASAGRKKGPSFSDAEHPVGKETQFGKPFYVSQPGNSSTNKSSAAFYSQVFVFTCFSTARHSIPACGESVALGRATTSTGAGSAGLKSAVKRQPGAEQGGLDRVADESNCVSPFYTALNSDAPYVMSPMTAFVPPVTPIPEPDSQSSSGDAGHWKLVKYTALFISVGIVGTILLVIIFFVAAQSFTKEDERREREGEQIGLLTGLARRKKRGYDDEDPSSDSDVENLYVNYNYPYDRKPSRLVKRQHGAGKNNSGSTDDQSLATQDPASGRGNTSKNFLSGASPNGSGPGAAGGASSAAAAGGTKPQRELLDGKYNVIRRLGKGSFSVVYLVERVSDKQQCALKYVQCADDLDRVEAMRECEVAYTLQGHPNVIVLIDMFMSYKFDTNLRSQFRTPRINNSGDGSGSRDDHFETVIRIDSGYYADEQQTGSNNSKGATDSQGNERGSVQKQRRAYLGERYLSLVMAYHEKGDLGRWVRSMKGGPRIPEATVVSIAFQVLSVLQFMHRRSPPIIHRDLKPENILLSSTMRYENVSMHFLPIVVTDFGLSRVMDKTFCETGVGSLPYVAPECWQRHYTVKVDIWALGCILYAVCAMRVEADNVKVMFSECNRPNFRSNLVSELSNTLGYSPALGEYIAHLLEVDPEARPTAMEALRMIQRRPPRLSDEANRDAAATPEDRDGEMIVGSLAVGGKQREAVPSEKLVLMYELDELDPTGQLGNPPWLSRSITESNVVAQNAQYADVDSFLFVPTKTNGINAGAEDWRTDSTWLETRRSMEAGARRSAPPPLDAHVSTKPPQIQAPRATTNSVQDERQPLLAAQPTFREASGSTSTYAHRESSHRSHRRSTPSTHGDHDGAVLSFVGGYSSVVKPGKKKQGKRRDRNEDSVMSSRFTGSYNARTGVDLNSAQFPSSKVASSRQIIPLGDSLSIDGRQESPQSQSTGRSPTSSSPGTNSYMQVPGAAAAAATAARGTTLSIPATPHAASPATSARSVGAPSPSSQQTTTTTSRRSRRHRGNSSSYASGQPVLSFSNRVDRYFKEVVQDTGREPLLPTEHAVEVESTSEASSSVTATTYSAGSVPHGEEHTRRSGSQSLPGDHTTTTDRGNNTSVSNTAETSASASYTTSPKRQIQSPSRALTPPSRRDGEAGQAGNGRQNPQLPPLARKQ